MNSYNFLSLWFQNARYKNTYLSFTFFPKQKTEYNSFIFQYTTCNQYNIFPLQPFTSSSTSSGKGYNEISFHKGLLNYLVLPLEQQHAYSSFFKFDHNKSREKATLSTQPRNPMKRRSHPSSLAPKPQPPSNKICNPTHRNNRVPQNIQATFS